MIKPKTEYVYVNKPVASCPGTPIPARPNLDIYGLTDKSSDGEVVRAYELSIKQLQSHIEQLETLLDRYNHLSDQLNSTQTDKTP